jgi:hypothetical protein
VKTATTLADAANLTKNDIFDLEGAYVETLAKTKRDNRQGVFHPSTVGMCGRRNVYDFIRTPAIPTIDPDDFEVFNMGHAVHALIQGKLAEVGQTLKPKKIGYEFEAEVPCPKETDVLYQTFSIAGTTDGILKIWADTWRQHGILEVKSIKDANFEKLREPKEDHVLQAHIYAYRFDCPVMWIWYFNKDTSRRKVYPLVYQQRYLDRALERFEGWLAHAHAGTLPDREESYWACPRCEYRDTCKPAVLAKIRQKSASVSKANLR